MSNVLETEGLSKSFGKIKAVQSLNLSIGEGQIFGILGPNGSGKTTTLGMVLDIISPTSGSFSWFGGEKNDIARRNIGSILETPCFYPYLSAEQNLHLAAHIKTKGSDNVIPILEKVNLIERKDDKFKTFSLGMKQRLSIASALLADPPVLILDEPTNGLDPEGIAEVRELIKSIASEGKTIIMASHLLDEVQKVCTDFCVLKKGRKLHEGSVEDTLGETNEVICESDDLEKLEKSISAFEGATSVQPKNESLMVVLKNGFNSSSLNAYCFEKGVSLKKLIPQSNSLEQEFLKILKEND